MLSECCISVDLIDRHACPAGSEHSFRSGNRSPFNPSFPPFLPSLFGSSRPDSNICIQATNETEQTMEKIRKGYWREEVASKVGTTIPKRLRKGYESRKGSVDSWIGEALRELGYRSHILHFSPTEHIFGIPPDELRAREKELYVLADQVKETYTRRGRTHKRRQKSTTPIMLMAVASWPEPTMERTPERDRWVRRVVRLAKSRWGKMLRGVYAHVDEAFYHLHLVVWADDGGPVKPHHAGHGCVLELLQREPGASRKSQAAEYVRGVKMAQEWYHHYVGRSFNWIRSIAPRPRRSRSTALRDRQAKIEAQEREIAQKNAAIAAGQAEVLEHTNLIKRALERLQAREAKLNQNSTLLKQQSAAVRRMREAVEDQLSLEQAMRSNLYEPPSVF